MFRDVGNDCVFSCAVLEADKQHRTPIQEAGQIHGEIAPIIFRFTSLSLSVSLGFFVFLTLMGTKAVLFKNLTATMESSMKKQLTEGEQDVHGRLVERDEFDTEVHHPHIHDQI